MESRDCCGITDIRRNRLNILFCNFFKFIYIRDPEMSRGLGDVYKRQL